MTHDIRIVTESELRAQVGLSRALIDVIEKAFVALAEERVIMPPVLSMEIPQANGEVDVKTAYVEGFDSFAIKVSPGFFDNPGIGLPSLNGVMLRFSARTGLVETVFLDNGYLTDLRTAAAGAVAARHLAPARVETAGVIGTGVQARLQMQAAHIERSFQRVLVHGRNMDHARKCARDLGDLLGIEAEAVADAGALVAASQLVVTTTPAREPVLRAEWLHAGLHITAMGSDQEGKNEIDPRALSAANLYVCDSVSQCSKLGELRAARAAGLWQGGMPPELGDIITGKAPGRGRYEDITICDLTGTGVQDTAIAEHVGTLAHEIGTVIAS